MIKISKTKKLKVVFAPCIIMLLLICIIPVSRAELNTNAMINASNSAITAFQQLSAKDTPLSANVPLYLQQHGYTNQSINSLSKADLTKLLLSFSGQDMNKSMQQICLDLFGNNTGPTNVAPKSTTGLTANRTSVNEQTDTAAQSGTIQPDTPAGGQACLIVAIWNYPYPPKDLYYNQFAYSALLNDVNNAGYNYVWTLTNNDPNAHAATHQYIWEWLTWMCPSYQYVDVYFMGHGVNNYIGDNGFCPYDAMDSNGNINFYLEYFPQEMVSYSTHSYDYSEKRLGIGGFCYSNGFAGAFIWDGIYPLVYADRVWLGFNGEGTDVYNEYFFMYWSEDWYVYGMNSLDAYNDATSYSQGNPLVYYPSSPNVVISYPIHYWILITAVDDYSNILYYNPIYLDYNCIGYGQASALVTPGWHNIDSENPTFDYAIMDNVWVQSGTGNHLFTSTTIITILY